MIFSGAIDAQALVQTRVEGMHEGRWESNPGLPRGSYTPLFSGGPGGGHGVGGRGVSALPCGGGSLLLPLRPEHIRAGLLLCMVLCSTLCAVERASGGLRYWVARW